jgi:ABC-2 type transport system permease protein
MNWARMLVSVELRRLFSYRLDLWVSFAGGLIIEVGIAYFLWSAIFQARSVSTLQGFTLPGLLLYQGLALTVTSATGGFGQGRVSEEIYRGSLSRFLIYPIPFYLYKAIEHLTSGILATVRGALGVGLVVAWAGVPPEWSPTLSGLLAALTVLFAATLFVFLIQACAETTAFWLDHVWSLNVLSAFIVLFFGGGFVPLAFFPAPLQAALEYTPFPALLSAPVELLLGRVSPATVPRTLGILALWSLPLLGLLQGLWRRGLRQYSGVGQ